MYKLHYFPGNANLAPHMILQEIGVPYELALVDRAADAQLSPEYKKLNPSGRIPTLEDGEIVLFETAAICLHLADKHPNARLAPALGTAARAHYYKWMVYLSNTVQVEMRPYFYPQRFIVDGTGEEAVRARAEKNLEEMFGILDASLARAGGPYLVGDVLTAADFLLFMLVRWGRKMARPPRDLPNLARHADLLASRPAVRSTFALEGIEPPYY